MDKTAQKFSKGDVVVATEDSRNVFRPNFHKGDIGVVDAWTPDWPRVTFGNWTGYVGDDSVIRKASPVEVAEYNLKKAQPELEAAQAAEKAAAEAKRKAEEEAKRFTEADVKNLMIVETTTTGIRIVVISAAPRAFLRFTRCVLSVLLSFRSCGNHEPQLSQNHKDTEGLR